jgi:hypothetical protein
MLLCGSVGRIDPGKEGKGRSRARGREGGREEGREGKHGCIAWRAHPPSLPPSTPLYREMRIGGFGVVMELSWAQYVGIEPRI